MNEITINPISLIQEVDVKLVSETLTKVKSLQATLKSILVDNESVTSDTTKNKDNITYIIEMPESTTLAPNA